MKSRIAAALAAAGLFAGAAQAQVALKADTPHLLFWSPEQQARWYLAMPSSIQQIGNATER